MRTVAQSTSSNRTATVISAVSLTEEERAALAEKLTARFSKDLNLRYEVDSSLLGGVVVRVGDKVIDGSLKGKLDALRQSLSTTG